MADSRLQPGFGQIDLDLEDDLSEPAASGIVEIAPPPPSSSRVFNTEAKRPTRRNAAATAAALHDESTRIVRGDPLSEVATQSTRPRASAGPLAEDGNTRAWADVDEAVFAASPMDDAPSSGASRRSNAPSSSGSSSGSGVATRDARVAAMRDLYAKGDADGALILAATLGSIPPPNVEHDKHDKPDSSIVVEYAEESISLEDALADDPFGGLILAEDDEVSARPLPSLEPAAPAPFAAQLSLTQRQSIPRMRVSLAAVSKLKMDHRAGFLLAHVDGMQTLEEILDVCAMPPTEALDLFAKLQEMGVIEFE